MMPPDPLAMLLRAAARGSIVADNAEAGLAALQARCGRAFDPAAFHAALAQATEKNLIHDPVRLPPGSLHCCWTLELTPSGHACAKTLTGG